MNKERILIGLTIVIISILIVGAVVGGTYNGMVTSGNEVDRAWSNVEAVYQRRVDTIPAFVETAKFSVEFQLELQELVAEARTNISNTATAMNPDQLESVANSEFNILMAHVVAEAVPEAKTEQITELNAEIDNVERLIFHERDVFNTAVRNYNNMIETIPGAWFASSWGHTTKQGFKAEPGADEFPDLNLGDE